MLREMFDPFDRKMVDVFAILMYMKKIEEPTNLSQLILRSGSFLRRRSLRRVV